MADASGPLSASASTLFESIQQYSIPGPDRDLSNSCQQSPTHILIGLDSDCAVMHTSRAWALSFCKSYTSVNFADIVDVIKHCLMQLWA